MKEHSRRRCGVAGGARQGSTTEHLARGAACRLGFAPGAGMAVPGAQRTSKGWALLNTVEGAGSVQWVGAGDAAQGAAGPGALHPSAPGVPPCG